MSRFLAAAIITAIEVVTLVVWLILAREGETLLSAGVLFVGLQVEHYVALLLGAEARTPVQSFKQLGARITGKE